MLLAGLCLSMISAPAAASVAAASSSPAGFQAFFDAALQQQMTDEHIAGATVAVVQNGELAFTKGYGYADLEAGIPVQADQTLFFIGSDGKLFTWTAVMQLAGQGKLDLHADVNIYLDFEIPAAFAEPVTLHHLMTHTAGFEDDYNSLLLDDPGKILPLREHLVRHMPAPGTGCCPGAVRHDTDPSTARFWRLEHSTMARVGARLLCSGAAVGTRFPQSSWRLSAMLGVFRFSATGMISNYRSLQ